MSSRIITDPPGDPAATFGRRLGGWWHEQGDRIVCDLCPRACTLKDGDRGFCFVRKNEGGQMVLTTYGLSTGFCVDPIEKKPLAHFYPGSSVLSFGTAGCNLGCKFCQNWTISKSREITDLSDRAGPEAIAEQAQRLGCRSVAFTYNDPVIWAEYALDCARACHERGIQTVAVTAGYISPGAREAFYAEMDAANVDLKAFTETFYQRLTLSHLQPVLDTLKYLKHETDVWFEITDLLIPDENDAPDEIERMCAWIAENLGTEVPLHFTAFHPDFRLRDKPRTPHETLIRAREQALAAGLKYVYVGNVFDNERQSTYCPNCGTCVIERDWHELGAYRLDGNRCANCGACVAGHFDAKPGDWGRRRLAVRIDSHPSDLPVLNNARQGNTVTREVEAPAEPVVAEGCPASAARQEPRPPAEEPRPGAEEPRPGAEEPRPLVPLPELDAVQRRGILETAARLVEQAVALGPNQLQCIAAGQTALQAAAVRDLAPAPVYGVFVSLKNRGQLRACCGNVGQTARLADSLTAAAIRSATADRRFAPIDYTELADLDLEVWLLHSPQRVEASGRARLERVVIGRHGLVLDQGQNRGLLLPGVAVEAGMDAAEFLEAVCRKAQLPADGWMNDEAQLSTFEGVSFTGRLHDYLPADWRPDAHPQYAGLLGAVREIWSARLNGGRGTPYWSGMADGDVAGILLTARALGGSVGHWSRLEPEGGMPLQATLAQLAEQAAEELAEQAAASPQALEGLHARLVVLRGGVPHSMPAGGDALRFEAARNALFVHAGARRALVLPPHENPRVMFQKACQSAGIELHEPGIMAWSFDCIQVRTPSLEKGDQAGYAAKPTTPMGSARANTTTAATPDSIRPAAKAGLFYPADAAQLAELVGSLIPAVGQPESWPAVMVPHAGLRYSGRIAGGTFARVKFPLTAIVIGPKHTPYGVPWAVDPHARWSLPGGTLEADRELGAALVEAVPGLEFDTAAHQQEHAVEVELPFLHKLAPQTRVVGVALGMADLDDCRELASHLAALVRGLRPAPLLVISSDMNHFAPETENRRLDHMAIDAMLRRDPEELYHTVRENNISMCGVLPAVIVMQTLVNLDRLARAELVGYTTSAETTGDTSSVVGYCGMLLG